MGNGEAVVAPTRARYILIDARDERKKQKATNNLKLDSIR
jgi:hypothetical protein